METGSAEQTRRHVANILGQPAHCTISDRSLGTAWHEAPGKVQVQVLGSGGRSGKGCWGPGPAWRFLALWWCHRCIISRRRNLSGWARVCGTEESGVWVLKGASRTFCLPENLDVVGVVWEHRSGYETAWATPGHSCSCSSN